MSSREGLTKWVTKSILVAIMLLVIVFVLEHYFHVKMLADTLLAITIVLLIAFTHEVLHYVEAVKLGYKPKWWSTRFKMGIEISSHSSRKKWIEDKKKIARAPYYFAVPVSIFFFIAGYQFRNAGMLFAGLGSLVLHALTYFSEGKEL